MGVSVPLRGSGNESFRFCLDRFSSFLFPSPCGEVVMNQPEKRKPGRVPECFRPLAGKW